MSKIKTRRRKRADKKKTKTIPLYLFFLASLFFMEIVLRIATTGNLISLGILFSYTFAASLAAVFALGCSFLTGNTKYITANILVFICGIFFAAQIGYFDTFTTFFTIYSAGNFSQILDFTDSIYNAFVNNLLGIAAIFLPVIFIVIWGKNIFSLKRESNFTKATYVGAIIIFHLLSLAAIHSAGQGLHTAHNLYYNSNYPLRSVDKLGLITTMRLDLQRHFTSWSPSLQVSNPADGGDNDKEEDSKGDKKGKIEHNVLDIDFETLIANEEDESILQLHKYFSSAEPTAKNEFTGKYEGYNLILITAESYAPYAVHEEITPTLYKLVNEGYRFTDFYVPLWDVSTTDGEYVALTGLIPKSGVWSFYQSRDNYLPFVMGNQLKDLGYNTSAYHNWSYDYYRRDLSHPNMGYDYKAIGNGLENVDASIWPPSDLEMMVETIPHYIDDEPFHAYYMTVSGHKRYNWYNHMASKNYNYVKDLPYSSQGQAYIATHVELDKALEHLLKELKEAGVAENTLIAMSSDHYPYGLDHEIIEELSGHEVDKHFGIHKSDFVLYTKKMEPKTIDEPTSSLDIIPTLSNLLGLEYDSRLLMGRDIFSDSDPLVIFRDHSFITNKGKYNATEEVFTPASGEKVDQEYVDKILAKIENKFNVSHLILDHDYYRHLLVE
ncbi:sulfatase-like hydrolase/transferase [Proteinivorax hydrogeniformans]|uniref:Sulfatase-like hydrolase/transferase n=1 Tax=Proteinivorax hydrogeniformans TaxID=1826727 RepID=A0AAU8HS23_9FIRM